MERHEEHHEETLLKKKKEIFLWSVKLTEPERREIKRKMNLGGSVVGTKHSLCRRGIGHC